MGFVNFLEGGILVGWIEVDGYEKPMPFSFSPFWALQNARIDLLICEKRRGLGVGVEFVDAFIWRRKL